MPNSDQERTNQSILIHFKTIFTYNRGSLSIFQKFFQFLQLCLKVLNVMAKILKQPVEITVIIHKKDSFKEKFFDHFVLFISTPGSQQYYSLSYSLPVFAFDMVWSGPVYPTKQVAYRKLSQKASRNLQTPCTSLYFLCNHWTIPCRAGVGETKGPN